MKVYPHKNRLYFDGANKETDETYVTTSTMGEKRARIKIAIPSLIEAGLDDKKINSFIGIHDLNYSKELDLYYIAADENEEDK